MIISEGLTQEALQILVQLGLEKRYPQECQVWRQQVLGIERSSHAQVDIETQAMREKLAADEARMTELFLNDIVHSVINIFPLVIRFFHSGIQKTNRRI